MDKVLELSNKDMKTDIPSFKAGDTISVGVKVVEGGRSRTQIF